MQLGIDWVSAGIFLVAFVVGQLRSLSPRLRYLVWAIALGLITLLRLRLPLTDVNKVFTAFAAGLTLYYAYKAIKAPGR